MLDTVDLGDEIALLWARLSVATQRLLTCIRSFDEREGWHRQGAQSCAHWLVWRTGIDPGAAREKVRVARALGVLPKIDQAFAAGRLSYSKVRAVTRIATPENEERVLDVALAATGAQLERICRGYRTATEDEVAAAVERRVRARVLGNGLVKLELVVSADEAELVITAIERARDDVSPTPAPAPRRAVVPPAAVNGATDPSAAAAKAPRPSAADALVHLVSTYLGGGEMHAPAVGPDHCQVVIHVDRELMSSGPELEATLDDGTRVSAETLRRVACDTGVIAAAVDEQGAVLDVGRRTRAIPTAIRRALWIRDQGCRFPGCANDRFLHGHHVQHWLHGGRTSLDNLVLLCSFHHRQVHEGGFTLRLTATGEVEVRDPGGACLPNYPTLPTVPTLANDDGLIDWRTNWWGDAADVDAWTGTPSSDGEPVDYDWVVGVLVSPDGLN